MTKAGMRRAGTALALALSASVLLSPPKAEASIFGEENATLGAILGESIAQLAEMAKTVAGITAQIQQLQQIYTQGQTMIEQGDTVLRGVTDPDGIVRLLRYAEQTLRLAGRSASLLKHNIDTIEREYEKVFPDMEDVPTQEFQQKAKTWNAALKESSAIAMQAQTSVATLKQRMERMEQLLNSTDTATGVVEQLQLVVRALGVLHTDLMEIESNIAFGQRVTAAMGAVEAAEAERSAEMHKRMIEGYTERGAPARALKELP
jgi:P-type conjugative transfer protein TrbJ